MQVDKDINFLKEMTKLATVRNCEELKNNGINVIGKIDIDPDGAQSGEPPISVVCNSDGSTEVGQETKESIGNCDGPGCHEVIVDYGVSNQQIQNLIQLSESCSQQISFRCYNAPLKLNSVHLGWWTSQDGIVTFRFVLQVVKKWQNSATVL